MYSQAAPHIQQGAAQPEQLQPQRAQRQMPQRAHPQRATAAHRPPQRATAAQPRQPPHRPHRWAIFVPSIALSRSNT